MALPQRHRLKGQRVFDRIYQKGRKTHGPFLSLRVLDALPQLLPAKQQASAPSNWRCGVVISSKVHKRSVRRNRLRRLIHDHLLGQQIGDGQGCLWLLLSLKPGSAEQSPEALLGECSQLLQQAGLTR
ncbi:MAG: ribonuclease P protein component [Cyanobacteria bacterium]|nr:ribonuclease P protein component [Cyanobacteriota bacterium]MDA1246369.1 ribonuclease P protein component [Cyanobacteriota bacterium]